LGFDAQGALQVMKGLAASGRCRLERADCEMRQVNDNGGRPTYMLYVNGNDMSPTHEWYYHFKWLAEQHLGSLVKGGFCKPAQGCRNEKDCGATSMSLEEFKAASRATSIEAGVEALIDRARQKPAQ
jgi:hypothetical protein